MKTVSNGIMATLDKLYPPQSQSLSRAISEYLYMSSHGWPFIKIRIDVTITNEVYAS